MLLRLHGLMNHIFVLSYLVKIKGREPCFGDVAKKLLWTVVLESSNFCAHFLSNFSIDFDKLISSKLGMLIGMTELYILISVWMAFTFTYRVMRKLELWQSFCWCELAHTLAVVDMWGKEKWLQKTAVSMVHLNHLSKSLTMFCKMLRDNLGSIF